MKSATDHPKTVECTNLISYETDKDSAFLRRLLLADCTLRFTLKAMLVVTPIEIFGAA
jgi:hypothetical protein